MKYKKAMSMYYIIIIGFFVGLAVFYVYSMYNQLDGQPRHIGELQLKYLESAQELENGLFYVDQAAKYSIYKALFDLGANGGFYTEPECGHYNGHISWQSLDIKNGKKQIRNCYPKNTKENFTSFLRENMNKYSGIYQHDPKESSIYKDNYDFFVEGSLNVIGFATLPLDYDLNYYEEAKIRAILINTECADATDLRACVKKEAGKINGLGVNFCPIFAKEEKECLDKNKNLAAGELPYVSWFGKKGLFGEKKFEKCDKCPISGAKCEDYIDGRYCTLDPCNLDCVWKNNKCQELTKSDIDKINNERMFGFCVLSDKELPYYNEAEKKLEKTPVAIKFAMYIEDLPPPPVEGLFVSDNKNAEKSVILRWKKSTAEDIDSYMVYHSKNNFRDKSMEAIRADDKIIKKEVEYDENRLLMFDFINLNNCELKRAKVDNKEAIKCIFDGGKLLEINKLYYIKEADEFVYILNIAEENANYYFAVSAVDIGGSEVNNIDADQKLNIIQGKSEDDLGPGLVDFEISLESNKDLLFKWSEVASNLVDDYKLVDLSLYNLYYKGCNEPTDMPLDKRESLAGDTINRISANLPHCGASNTYTYYFLIIAKDDENNPKLGFDELRQIGLIVKEASITDNQDGTFSINSITDRNIQPPANDVGKGQPYKANKKE